MTDPTLSTRYIVDPQPTVRVLDRAYNHAIVREWLHSSPRRSQLDDADALAAELNRADEDGLLEEAA